MRGFFAYEDAKTPLIVLLFGTLVTVGTGLWLSPSLGVAGLASGFAAGMAFNALVLFGIFWVRVKPRDIGQFSKSILSFVIASVLAGLAARVSLFWVVNHLVRNDQVWGLLAQAILATVVGGIVYLVFAWVLRVPEFDALWSRLKLYPPKEKLFTQTSEDELPR